MISTIQFASEFLNGINRRIDLSLNVLLNDLKRFDDVGESRIAYQFESQRNIRFDPDNAGDL